MASFLPQWVRDTEQRKQTGRLEPAFPQRSRDAQHRCIGQITARFPKQDWACACVNALLLEPERPRHHLPEPFQKHNFSHRCTSMFSSSSTAQYGYLLNDTQAGQRCHVLNRLSNFHLIEFGNNSIWQKACTDKRKLVKPSSSSATHFLNRAGTNVG